MEEYYNTFFVIWFNMDDDISIIDSNTRKEKIKNFLFENKKKLITFFVAIILAVVLFFGYGEFIKIQNKKI